MFSFVKKCAVHKNQIFIRDFLVEMEIGVNDDEKGRKQRVLINVAIEPKAWPNMANDNINETVSYDDVVKIIHAILNEGHIHLVETFAERIAQRCLKTLTIKNITVRVEKLDIYGFAIPGVEIIRKK